MIYANPKGFNDITTGSGGGCRAKGHLKEEKVRLPISPGCAPQPKPPSPPAAAGAVTAPGAGFPRAQGLGPRHRRRHPGLPGPPPRGLRAPVDLHAGRTHTTTYASIARIW